jgi:hypothetical protein
MHILEKDILEVMEEACDLFISEVHRLVISSYLWSAGL